MSNFFFLYPSPPIFFTQSHLPPTILPPILFLPFIPAFPRFLTKREQQLMQRRHHAEELLQWKQRLDQEEAEVRRMEKEALAVWDGQTPRDVAEGQANEISDISPSPSHHRSSEPRTDSEKGEAIRFSQV